MRLWNPPEKREYTAQLFNESQTHNKQRSNAVCDLLAFFGQRVFFWSPPPSSRSVCNVSSVDVFDVEIYNEEK